MRSRNYSGTAAYFEHRAAKTRDVQRRQHLQAMAKFYQEKARETGERIDDACTNVQPSSRRERVAAMFRAFGDSESVVRSTRQEPSQ